MAVVMSMAAACAPRAAPALAGDGELVLELGGASPSLAASLERLGVELLPAQQVPPGPLADVAPPERGPSASDPSPDSAPDRDQAAPPEPSAPPTRPAPAWFEVELGPRQTLMDLAQEHLGSARRFKEIMDLNGWSDRDARRLRVGTLVKVPRATGR